jgi:hypothetical protein
MKRTIRQNVFETNSSSTHSLSISNINNIDNTIKDKYLKLNLFLRFDEFGWGYDNLETPQDKLTYILTMITNNNFNRYNDNEGDIKERLLELDVYKRVNNVVKKYTGKDIYTDINIKDFGHIDHQSNDILDEWLDDEEKIASIIFNSDSCITIDNDNH